MRVAAAGDNCIDVYVEQGRSYPGGNAVNVAVYLRRLGVESSYVGAVGDDAHGDLLRRALQERGVDTSHLHVTPGSTALTQISVVDGNRVFGEHAEGVMADFRLTADDVDFLCGHDLVVSGIWGHTAQDLAALKARGATVAFDYSDQPQDPVVEATLGDVDYAFFGLETDDGDDLRDFMRRVGARGPAWVVVTLGERGSIAYDGEAFTVAAPVACEVVDTMGAGDSYIAGFLTGVLERRPLAECMARGAASSAVTITYPGAW